MAVTAKTPLLQLEVAWQTEAVERNQKMLSLVGASGFAFILHPEKSLRCESLGTDQQRNKP